MTDEIKLLKESEFSDIIKDSRLTFLLIKTYTELTGCKNPKFCEKYLRKYYDKIINFDDMAKKKTTSNNFKLKSGLRVQYKGIIYTASNMTDELASKLIKENKANLALFESNESGDS